MRWTVFAIAAYVMAALEVGLARHLAIDTSSGIATPSFLLVLAVYLAFWAPSRTAVFACGFLGLLADLAGSPYALAGGGEPGAVTIVGPSALGYAAGGYMVVLLRPMLIRRHPLALAVMSILAGAEAQLVALGLLWLRQWYEPIAGFNAVDELLPRFIGLIYTGGLALFLAFPFSWSAGTFAFPTQPRHHQRLLRSL